MTENFLDGFCSVIYYYLDGVPKKKKRIQQSEWLCSWLVLSLRGHYRRFLTYVKWLSLIK